MELRDSALVARKLIALANKDPSGKDTLDSAEQLRKADQQIVLILEDALAYRTPSAVGQMVDLTIPMKSDVGKRLAVDLEKRAGALREHPRKA